MIFYAILICIYILFIFNIDRKWMRYHSLNLRSFNLLKKNIQFMGFKYSFKQHLLTLLSYIFTLIISCLFFSLNIELILLLVLVLILSVPLLVMWQFQFNAYEREFHYLTSYLQQFIAIFKYQPKILYALIETEKILNYHLKEVVLLAIDEIQNKGDVEKGLRIIQNHYPHFIVFNLHTLASAVELYGADTYYEGLNLIQDDIDDWIEDIFDYKQKGIELKNKIVLMCGMSVLIAYLAKQMLLEIELTTSTVLYQESIFLFFMIIITTIVMAHRIYQKRWIEKSEEICFIS